MTHVRRSKRLNDRAANGKQVNYAELKYLPVFQYTDMVAEAEKLEPVPAIPSGTIKMEDHIYSRMTSDDASKRFLKFARDSLANGDVPMDDIKENHVLTSYDDL